MSRIKAWASRSRWRMGLVIVVAVFVLIQLVPYGHSHNNPPVTK